MQARKTFGFPYRKKKEIADQRQSSMETPKLINIRTGNQATERSPEPHEASKDEKDDQLSFYSVKTDTQKHGSVPQASVKPK